MLSEIQAVQKTRERGPGPAPTARVAAAACYLVPSPLKGIVAPISREALGESLAHGKVVYLATHGESGPLVYRDGAFTPQDVAQGMRVGKELRLVYLAACQGGELADQWRALLAPAGVVSYPRFSAYLEHAYWLWIRLPRFIAAQS